MGFQLDSWRIFIERLVSLQELYKLNNINQTEPQAKGTPFLSPGGSDEILNAKALQHASDGLRQPYFPQHFLNFLPLPQGQ